MANPNDDRGESPVCVPELTAAIASGNEAAMTRFHSLYWKRIYAYVMVLTKGEETLSADLAQTTMLRAATHLCAMDSDDALWAWLRRVARNALVDAHRARSRQPTLVQLTDDDLVGPDDARSTEKPLLTALDEALQGLTARDHRLIEETYFNGRRQAELAGELGLSLKAVESRLTRLRTKLRQSILAALRDEGNGRED